MKNYIRITVVLIFLGMIPFSACEPMCLDSCCGEKFEQQRFEVQELVAYQSNDRTYQPDTIFRQYDSLTLIIKPEKVKYVSETRIQPLSFTGTALACSPPGDIAVDSLLSLWLIASSEFTYIKKYLAGDTINELFKVGRYSDQSIEEYLAKPTFYDPQGTELRLRNRTFQPTIIPFKAVLGFTKNKNFELENLTLKVKP